MSLPLEEPKKGSVYILADYNAVDLYKIGVSCRNIQDRLAELNQSPGSAVKLLFLSPPVDNYKAVEKKVHTFFKQHRTRTGENKSLREWFILRPRELDKLLTILSYEFSEEHTKILRGKIPYDQID